MFEGTGWVFTHETRADAGAGSGSGCEHPNDDGHKVALACVRQILETVEE
jgi:hypothetical protein